MKNKLNIILVVIVTFLLLGFGYILFFWEKKIEQNKNIIIKKEIIEKDYSDLWINPNDYEKIEDFLEDYKTFSWAKIDIEKNDFVTCVKDDKWNISYTPFYHSFVKEWLFKSKELKNEAIVNIYKAHKNDCINYWFISKWKTKIIFEEDIAHNDTYILNNIFTKKTNINDTIKELEKVPNKSIEKKELISYLYDLKWDYKKANKNREKTCLENEITCSKTNKFKLYWKVLDENNKPLSWVKITLLNQWKTIKSDKDWNYNFELDYYPFSHLRFKASKNWYSDWFKTISFNNSNWTWEKREKLDFHINKAHYTEERDINEFETINWKKYFVFKTKQSRYLVPINWLYYNNWNKWKWKKLKVYMYEFKKSDNISDLVQWDTFSPISGYVWNLMKTFWMPYIQFFDKSTNRELFVYKSNPMILQNNIYHMKELYNNHDKIYEAITKEDMKFLVEYSKEKWGYPIDFEFLVKYNFLRWPAWWALDRRKWVWEAIPAKVISVDWLIETEFYSINDL